MPCSSLHSITLGGGTVADGKGGILRRGKWIPIQMTAAGWRKGKFRGKVELYLEDPLKVLQIAQPPALSQVSISFWHVHHQKVDSIIMKWTLK